MQAQLPFLPAGASEEVTRTFDFSLALAAGETLTADSASCEITVTEGDDDSASDRLLAGPTIDGTLVTVLIGDMIDGVTYRVLCIVRTSAGQKPTLWSPQKCVGP